MSANAHDSSLQQSLSQAQLNAQSLLTEFALSEDFLSGIKTAFGDDFNQSILEQFYQQWKCDRHQKLIGQMERFLVILTRFTLPKR